MGSAEHLVQRHSPGLRTFAILAALAAVPALSAQGFGIVKMTARLQRKRPPAVYLMGTAIAIRVEAQDPGAGPITGQFETLLANELCRNDSRLRIEKAHPETMIQVAVTLLRAEERFESRQVKEFRKIGQKQVWNEKKNQYETKDDYANVDVTKQYKVLDGALTAGLSVTEASSGNVLHAETISETYRREFLDGNGAPVSGRLPIMLMEAAVRRMLPAVVPTIEMLDVQMAKGKLEDSSKLGQSGLWARMLETLEAMPPLKKPQDDAYRLYDIGVACEALAYQAEDAGVSRKLLEQAAIGYGKAIDMKPDERYFREPQVRIQTAIAQLGKAEGQKAMYARSLAGKSKGLESRDTFTNQNVIDLVRSGLDESILCEMIGEAPQAAFDLGGQGTLQLLNGKVSNRVIAAMRARAARK